MIGIDLTDLHTTNVPAKEVSNSCIELIDCALKYNTYIRSNLYKLYKCSKLTKEDLNWYKEHSNRLDSSFMTDRNRLVDFINSINNINIGQLEKHKLNEINSILNSFYMSIESVTNLIAKLEHSSNCELMTVEGFITETIRNDKLNELLK